MAPQILTDRLLLRPWRLEDAPAALASYGDAEVARWLTPAMDRVPDEAAMGRVLQGWMADNGRMLTPAGRWAVELQSDGNLVGGATLLASGADQGLEQVIALVRPANARADAMVRRMGMEWVGETEKYHNLRLQEFRLRPADLAAPRE